MKTLLLFALICCGNLPAQRLIKTVFFKPSSLNEVNIEFMRMVDSVNRNEMKRIPILDSAANYHTNYLFRLNKNTLMRLDNKITLTHYEVDDIDNFEEKRYPSDRTGSSMTYEICHLSCKSGGKFLNAQSAHFFKMIEKNGNAIDLLNIIGNYDDAKDIFKGYKSSPPHYEIINSDDVSFYGSQTTLYGSALLYESEDGMKSLYYYFLVVNVMNFFDKKVPKEFVNN